MSFNNIENDEQQALYNLVFNSLIQEYNMFDDVIEVINDIDIDSILTSYTRNIRYYTNNIITNFIANELNNNTDDDYDRILNETFDTTPEIERNKSPIDFKSQTYENVKNNNDNECSICLVQYEKTDMVSLTNCKHLFHTSCIEECSRYKYECPVCRQNLK